MGRKDVARAMMGGITNLVPALGSFDAFGMGKLFSQMNDERDRKLASGKILMYNPNTHTAAVDVYTANEVWTCSFIDELASTCFGYSQSNPPREGDIVAVVQDNPCTNSGVIVGRMPVEWDFTKGDIFNDPEKYLRCSWLLDTIFNDGGGSGPPGKTNSHKVMSYLTPLTKINEPTTHFRLTHRPTDVVSGEMAELNQHNCGIRGGAMSCTLFGGGASVRTSVLTNGIRETCENYQRFSMSGTTHEFHNGRYLSEERDVACFQEERLGWHSPESGGGMSSQVWTEDSEAPQSWQQKKNLMQTMRARFKEYSGYFGHLMARYFLRPDPNDSKLRVMDEELEPKEEGVTRETVDPSGQYRLSAAGMLTIERTGRIPIPVRKALPTDLDHDIDNPEVLKPFEHKEGNPTIRQLELFDRQAYDLKTQYARVDGLGAKKPDHYVPQEEELKPLKDPYDPKYDGNRTVYLEKYDKRRAGMYIGEDGSVFIRDAWGSEIAMVGGNVSISCPGNVQVLPGESALVLGGDDVVIKAQNSVDVHASEHDIRLSAARNMEIVGGADERSHQGGVVIQSNCEATGPWDGTESKGEGTFVNGVAIKSKNGNVVIDGNRDIIRSKESTHIVSGDEDVDGTLYMSAKHSRQYSKDMILVSDESAVNIGSKSVTIASGNIGLYGKSGLSMTRGSKAPAIMWMDIDGNPAEEILSDMEDIIDFMKDEVKVSAGYGREMLLKMIFGFRTSEQCDTMQSWEIGGSGPFALYEPAWVQIHKLYDTLKNGGVYTKVYKEDGEWDNGKPWPGKEAEDSAQYVEISGLEPKNIVNGGYNRRRDSVEKETEIETPLLKSEYRVRGK